MLLVVFALDRPTTIRFADRSLHRASDAIGVEDGPPVQMARRATNGLDQGAITAQKAFLVGIKDRHQRDLWHVEPFAQQVDPDQHIELAESQPAHDFHTLDGVNVRMHVAHPNTHLLQIIGKILRHALGERRDQHAFALTFPQANLVQEIVHLPLDRADLQDRIEQPRGPDDLLDDHTLRQLQLELSGRRRDVYEPRHQLHEFFEHQRAIVECTW